MNFEEHELLAHKLRDQGLADILCAQLGLRLETPVISGTMTSFAHLVVSKCQQASEKLIKAFFQWCDRSFDPTQGHTPLLDYLKSLHVNKAFVRDLVRRLELDRAGRAGLVGEIKKLEELAPHPPEVPEADRGKLVPLNLVRRNSEYPFWHAGRSEFVTPAESLSIIVDGVWAMKATLGLARVMARSDPAAFTEPIRRFLDEHRPSFEVQ